MRQSPLLDRTIVLALCTLLSGASAVGQEDKAQRDAAAAAMQARTTADTTGNPWSLGGVLQFNLTQVSLTNWSAGGFNSLSGIAQFNAFANRHKGKYVWDNSVALSFGGQLQSAQGQGFDDGTPSKTDDRIELNSKWGYELKKPWYFASVAQFRTQFTEGFDATGNRISHLFAPAYFILGVGFDHRPNEDLSLFISPVTMKLTIVNDVQLFGGSTDPELRVYGVKNGTNTELEVGGYFRAQYKKDLAKNISFLTRGDLFSNYLRNPQNIDITWETLWTLKVNSWFAATLNTMLIYDHDIDVPKLENVGGVLVPDPGPGTQFKQTLGLGLTLKI